MNPGIKPQRSPSSAVRSRSLYCKSLASRAAATRNRELWWFRRGLACRSHWPVLHSTVGDWYPPGARSTPTADLASARSERAVRSSPSSAHALRDSETNDGDVRDLTYRRRRRRHAQIAPRIREVQLSRRPRASEDRPPCEFRSHAGSLGCRRRSSVDRQPIDSWAVTRTMAGALSRLARQKKRGNTLLT